MGRQGFRLASCVTKCPHFAVVDNMSTVDVDEAVCMVGSLPNTTGIVLFGECADLATSAIKEEDLEDKL